MSVGTCRSEATFCSLCSECGAYILVTSTDGDDLCAGCAGDRLVRLERDLRETERNLRETEAELDAAEAELDEPAGLYLVTACGSGGDERRLVVLARSAMHARSLARERLHGADWTVSAHATDCALDLSEVGAVSP